MLNLIFYYEILLQENLSVKCKKQINLFSF